ncbi:fimbrial protein [Burkholderia cepacia]|uniref:fimbrial protein n=1 Tax=Burkholderia cepacia TaxID=292 RepID=UPI001F0DDBF3|nr:fimbrial protein [Burkholderia cepacia]
MHSIRKQENQMTHTTTKGTRTTVDGWLRAIASIGAAAGALLGAAPSHALDVTAFGQQISIPKNTPSGTVLARHYVSPQQACGKPTCSITTVWNYPYGGSSGPGPTVETNVSGVSTRMLINGRSYPTTEPVNIEITQPIEVQLLGDGRTNTGGSLAGTNGNPAYFGMKLAGGQGNIFISLKGTITPIDGTCSVPNQKVTLPSVSPRKFGDVGSVAGTYSFQVRVENCPKGYNRVGYSLNPVGGVIANAPGVLPVGADTTAKGVQIRIANNAGTPVTFDQSIKLDAYNKATGGSFAIPMQASYIKTGPTVDTGTVSGSMVVLMDYQ